ncbi:MAG: hypothetical protein V4671_17555 [Armatimonadota bacterium]
MAINLRLLTAVTSVSLFLLGGSGAGCASKAKTVGNPASPAASTGAVTDAGAATAKDAPNTAQLEKPE